VWLGIYAKAEDRLRLEIRHYKNPRRTYQVRLEEYPNDHLEEMVPFNEFIGQRAHERAAVFFEALRGQVGTVPASVARLSDLVAEVSRACDGDDDKIRLVLSLLIASGRVAQTTDPEMRTLLGELERAGVLARTRSTRRRAPVIYAIRDRYAGTLQALRRVVEREVQGQT
jgi:hypothetical protein